jgi:hypothetical protein
MHAWYIIQLKHTGEYRLQRYACSTARNQIGCFTLKHVVEV